MLFVLELYSKEPVGFYIARNNNILKFDDIYNLYLNNFMYSNLNGSYGTDAAQYHTNTSIHSHNTRPRTKLHMQTSRIHKIANRFLFQGPNTDKLVQMM